MSLSCAHGFTEEFFVKGMNSQLWRSNALMAANAGLVAIMMVLGASGRRYRQEAVTRFLFLGASTLYLPIVSYVVSSIGKEYRGTEGLNVACDSRLYLVLLLIWTVLVQIVGTNTSAIVAADDYDGGQKFSPSIELLARTIWISYLVFYYSQSGFLTAFKCNLLYVDSFNLLSRFSIVLTVLCLLSLAKIFLKFYAFHKAKHSLALGRNPRLIAGYMAKLHGESPRARDDESILIPPLIVMGEEKQQIEEMPHGYSIKERNNSLVTVDMVWRMATSDAFLVSRTWLKDLCLSFALFKLLRRRFAKCHFAESGSRKVFAFVLDLMLNNGSPERVFNVIADELSFMLDSYYTSLPTSHLGRLRPVLNFTVSLSIIVWCLAGCAIVKYYTIHHPQQITCGIYPPGKIAAVGIGNINFNVIPTLSLFVAVIIAEGWEIVSYLCSNWIKVTLLCSYVTHASWQRSAGVQRWLGLVMKFRVKFRRWKDHMGQMFLLPAQQQQQPKIRYGMSRLFFCFSNPKMHHVKVSSEVKAAIVDALRNSNGCLSRGTAALSKSRIGNCLLWACQGKSTSDMILAWHISTGIFEARQGGSSSSSTSSRSAKNRAVATHLSRYCIYLMAAAPELLPDDTAWSKKLQETVSKDIERSLSGEPVEHNAMAERLNGSELEVVRRGAMLGKQLLELIPDEETGWALLASFWSEMILYVAPSDNPNVHKKAIAGGIELLTLIWALLTHAGIVTRPSLGPSV